MTDKHAVFGNPIAHSKSPEIHKMFALETHQDLVYERQLVEIDQFSSAARSFFAGGGCGLNITVPFKLEAFEFADLVTQRALQAGAVNTLKKMPDGQILGDNTDGAGFMRDITHNLGWDISGKKVLILGAGGAVRGILAPLLAENPSEVVIANRSPGKAQELIDLFAHANNLFARDLNELSTAKKCKENFDVIINGTASSLGGEMPDLSPDILTEKTYVYDLMYSNQLSPFLRWAKQKNAVVSDGLGMLVEQAAESFYLWHGVRPTTDVVIHALR